MKSIVIICLVCSTFVCYSQTGRLIGTVTDKKGDGLISVVVVTDFNTMGAITNLDGGYEIANLPEGSYNVRFKYKGKRHETSTVKIRSGETKILNIVMLNKGAIKPPVNYRQLAAELLKIVQEQQAKIEQLHSDIQLILIRGK